MRRATLLALAVALATGPALAQPPAPAPATAVMATITRMTEAVNKGEMATAFAAFTPSPTIVEDLAPYAWHGPGTPQAWVQGMGTNAQAHGITGIDMKLSPATRIEVTGDRAYALVPGRLGYVMKDGHAEHAMGLLTVILQRIDGDWKIDLLAWSGPVATP